MKIGAAACVAWLALGGLNTDEIVSSALAQTAPSAAQRQEGATRFEKGLDLYKKGAFRDALLEFRHAQELAPHYGILYYIGESYLQLQDYPNALSALERYLHDAGSAISQSRKGETEQNIRKLKELVARVDIVTKDPGVEIFVDEVSVGKSPLSQPIVVGIGRHKFKVVKAGLEPATMVVKIVSGKPVTVALNPLPPSDAPPTRHHHHHTSTSM